MDESNFFSMDRLIEFGMGVAVAKQMADTMNQSIARMTIPGAGKASVQNYDKVYYAVIEGKAAGPYSVTEMARLVDDRKIFKETYVWKPGMANWELAENVEELLKLIALTPPPIPK